MKIETPVKSSVTPVKSPTVQKVRSYTIDLPSKGQLYDGKSSVEITFLTTLDIKRLYNINKGTQTDSIEKLVGSKLLDFKVEDLTISDFWYILYWMRLNSFEKLPLELEWTCDKESKTDNTKLCNTSQKTPITGSSLVILEIDADYKEPAKITLSDGSVLPLRLLRVGDSIKIEELTKSRFKGKITEGDDWLLRKAAQIDNGKDLYDNYVTVSSMNTEDFFLLDSFEMEFSYGVKNVVNMTCSGCQEVSLIPFQIRLAHFFPSVQRSGFIRDAVRFGSES